MTKRYRLRKHCITAKQWNGKNADEFHKWLGYDVAIVNQYLYVYTNYTLIVLYPDDWMVYDDTQLYKLSNMMFNEKYEEV